MDEFMASPMQFWRAHHAWIVGVVLISLSSYTRFNTPPTSRSSTTWGRYYLAAYIYVAVTVVGWIVLATTPDLLAHLSAEAKVDPQLTQLAAPLYAALALSLLVSSFKPFRQADEKLRSVFHDVARIPWEAKRLSDALRGKTWLPTSQLQERVRTALREAEFQAHDISFADDRSPQALWTKITALHAHHVLRWQSGQQRRFAAFYAQHRADFQKLSDDYEASAGAARRLFRLLDTLRPMQGDPKLVEVQEELIHRFLMGAARLEKDICDLTSRALLQCALTEKARREELEAMGFVVNVAPDPMFDRMVLLGVVLAGLHIILLWLGKRPAPLLTGAMIGTIYVGAVLSARWPKRWAWARPHGGQPPIRGYVLSGAMAFAGAMVFLGGLGVLRTWDVALAAQMLSERWWPWGLMAVGTAMATAYNIDTEERPGRRWVEAALQAAVGAAGALIVYLRFQEACGPEPACALPLGGILLAGLISGGVIGWFVPTWCREPQTMTIDYKGWTVLVTAYARPNGHIAPAIEVMRFPGRGQRLSADAAALPFAQEFPSAEEALAKAVAYGRQHIDADGEVTGPARAHAA